MTFWLKQNLTMAKQLLRPLFKNTDRYKDTRINRHSYWAQADKVMSQNFQLSLHDYIVRCFNKKFGSFLIFECWRLSSIASYFPILPTSEPWSRRQQVGILTPCLVLTITISHTTRFSFSLQPFLVLLGSLPCFPQQKASFCD